MSDTRRKIEWTKDPVAYDYDAQRWVVGDEATKLLAAQETIERAILDGPQGDAFRAFTRKTGRTR